MFEVRGKEVRFTAYALMKMDNRAVQVEEACRVIEEGIQVPTDRLARLWVGTRTVIVYYEERESYHYVRDVGVTRRRV